MASVFRACAGSESGTPCSPRCSHKWVVRYREPGGRSARQREKSFSLKKAAEAFGTKMESDKDQGTYIDPSRGSVTIKAFAEQFLKNRAMARKTRLNYAGFVDNHLIPNLGRKTLAGVRTSDVQAFVATMAARMEPSTVKTNILMLSAIFNAAVADKRISENPCKGVTLPRTAGRAIDETKLPKMPDVHKLAGSIEPELSVIVYLMVACGARISEALAVRPRCIHGSVLRFSEQTSAEGLVPLKHRAAGDYRDVPLPDFLADMIRDHAKNHDLGDDDLLVLGPKGEPMIGNRFRYRWAKACKAAGLTTQDGEPRYTPHDLRHLFASTALAAGVPITDVSAWLGHQNIKITYDTYAHLLPSSGERMRAVMQEACQPG